MFFDYSKETGAKVLVYRYPNVFGKWCKPNYNSAAATFCYNIAHDLPISVRDREYVVNYNYVDDIVEGVKRVMMHAPERENGEDGLPVPPYRVYNIGNNSPENLLDFVDILQQELIRAEVLPADYDFEAHKQLVPMQAGDVPVTYADTSALERDFGFKPSTSLRDGLRKFAEWYKEFYM